MISQETISKVHEATNIVDVIGDYVKLKKRGANFVGLSPFSNERTPSFTVSPVKNIFKCFSSGKAGNAVSFLMEYEKMSYPESIKHLAAKYKIEVVEDNVSDQDKENVVIAETLFLVNKIAADFFNSMSCIASSYFSSRGIEEESISKWQLGYSAGNGTINSLILSDKISRENAIWADLAYLNQYNQLTDKYQDRIMFPFHNLSGRIVGFSGRTLKDDKTIAKYTNTKENEIFHKGFILYGIFFARKAIIKADSCNIVEGQLDVISMHQHGFENTVGTGGTAITKEHLLVIKRFCSRVCFIFDGDEAGKKAVGRGIELAVELGLSVNVLTLPEKEDPDSFLLKYGADTLSDYIKSNTGDIIDFYMGDGKSISEEEKQVNGRILLKLIAIIGNYDIFRRAPKVIKLHKLFNVDIKKLNEAIDRIQVNVVSSPLGDLFTPSTGSDAHEFEFVRVLLKYGHLQYSGEDFVYYYLLQFADPANFKNNVCNKIIVDYWQNIKSGIMPGSDHYTNFSDPEVVKFATDVIFDDFQLSDTWEGLVDINPNYKAKVKSALLFFSLSCIRMQLEEIELKVANMADEYEKDELIKKRSGLSDAFCEIADQVGISYIK
jgi:DNA primase